MPGHHICYKWSCSFHIGLECMAQLCDTSSLLGWHLYSGFFCFSFLCLLVFVVFLSVAHFGYLHFIKTSWRCCSSLFSSWGLEHIALALCVRVLITLYLQARLWWLSHWRYKSVWVGFLYTLGFWVLSIFGVINLSGNGMEPSGLVSSVVNMMERSTELMCCKNSSLYDCCCMT